MLLRTMQRPDRGYLIISRKRNITSATEVPSIKLKTSQGNLPFSKL